LGWSHGDDEIFSMDQFCSWFDLDHITPSAAQFNTEKLNWLNSHYIKEADLGDLATDISRRLALKSITLEATAPDLQKVIALYRDRVNTLNELADSIVYFYKIPAIDEEAAIKHITSDILPAIKTMAQQLVKLDWSVEEIHALINQLVTEHALKFPKIAMPLRVMLTGNAQSPSIDAVMYLLGRDEVISRIKKFTDSH
ncbi:MAG TPA: glutamate--tRNA ligase, partial [Methyloradius sp.]